MFLPACSSLPLLPPPFSSILSTHYTSSPASTNDQFSNNQPSQRRSNAHQPDPSSLHKPNSLHNLLLDESAIASRKAAIATYGYSWLRPAGVAKTMLGRREEEAEREEMERQMREQEEMELEMERGEELERQMRLREQQQQAGVAGGEEIEQRNLDDDVPDADDGHGNEREGDADLDDEIPDADADEDDNVEGETGITDEVENTNLGGEDTSPLPAATTNARPGNRGAQNPNERQVRAQPAQGAPQAYTRRQGQEQAEQEALANAMLDEDEQAFAERDLDADIPEQDENGMEGRDLDNDVPEADGEYGEGEWQHTDTELDEDESAVMLMEGEADVSMDMSDIDGRRSVSGVTGNMQATSLIEGSSMLQTPATGGAMGDGSRRWLNPRSLSGMGRTGNLFASGASPQTPAQTEAQEREEPQPPPRRRSGRRALGRENRSARESLD